MAPCSPAEPPTDAPAPPHDGPPTGRSGLGLAVRTTLVMTWFAAMFFALGPWLVLRATGTDVAAALREAPAAATAFGALVAGVLVWQIVDFVRRGDGTPAPFDPPRRFIAEGVYRRTRNPMYLLYVAVMLAEAWLFRSAALLAYTAGFFGLAHLFVTRVEEPGLRRRFGDAYARYCDDVPRWLW